MTLFFESYDRWSVTQDVEQSCDHAFDAFVAQQERDYYASLERENDAYIERLWYEHIGFDPIAMGM